MADKSCSKCGKMKSIPNGTLCSDCWAKIEVNTPPPTQTAKPDEVVGRTKPEFCQSKPICFSTEENACIYCENNIDFMMAARSKALEFVEIDIPKIEALTTKYTTSTKYPIWACDLILEIMKANPIKLKQV